LAMAETVRARAEEFRTKIKTRIEEIRGGSSSSGGILGGSPQILKGPLVMRIREKGLIATARERIEKLRAPPAEGAAAEEVASPSPSPEVYEKPRVKTYTAKIKTY